MYSYWQIAVCSFWSLAAIVSSAALAALSFAIASYKFESLKKRSFGRFELSGAAKFCVSNSEKMAAIISLGRRFLFAAAAIGFYFIFDAIGHIFEIESSASVKFAFALSASVAVLFVQYSIFDLPAAHFGRNHPYQTLRRLSAFLYIAFVFLAPLEFAARATCKRIFGKKTYNVAAGFNYIDVELMLRARENETESITPYTGKIVNNAFKLQELDVSDVMLPRSQVVYFDTDCANSENLERARTARHTRYPLCKDNLDNCFGIIHIKDIFTVGIDPEKIDFMSIRRQTIKMRENDKLEVALAKLLKYKMHMALVEDEFGGVIGLFTLDAALSELVGQIRDEFDAAPDNSISVLGGNSYKISALATLRKVEDFLDVDFDTDEVSTFGGLITFLLGRFPEKGERLYLKKQRMRIVVDDVQERSVGSCTVTIEDEDGSDKSD